MVAIFREMSPRVKLLLQQKDCIGSSFTFSRLTIFHVSRPTIFRLFEDNLRI